MRLSKNLGVVARRTPRLDVNTLENMGILHKYSLEYNFYRYMMGRELFLVTQLPRPEYFNRHEGKWKVHEETQANWEQQPEQAPEPAPEDDLWEVEPGVYQPYPASWAPYYR